MRLFGKRRYQARLERQYDQGWRVGYYLFQIDYRPKFEPSDKPMEHEYRVGMQDGYAVAAGEFDLRVSGQLAEWDRSIHSGFAALLANASDEEVA